MRARFVVMVGLALAAPAAAQPLVQGWVRLASGEPVAAVQVLVFDLTDLQGGPVARTTTDGSGRFALPPLGEGLPQSFSLGPNYPNPFNPSTIIPYQLPAAAPVRLEVFNLLGQRIATLVDRQQPAGFHTAAWNANNAAGQAVAAGVYLYRLQAGDQQQTKRMVLIDGQAGVAGAGAWTPASTPAAEAAPRYGLVVTGAGVEAWADADFHPRPGDGALAIVVEAADRAPRGKVLTGGILGDVNGDGRVDFFDALLVALYSVDPSLVLPNDGSISLGDVNADGRVDLTDAHLIAAYLNDPSDPSLPPGIGHPAQGASAPVTHIYWTDAEAGKIQRANLDGSSIQDLVTGLTGAYGIALDVVGRKVYWTDWSTRKIQRANLDGSNVQNFGTGPLAHSIALDAAEGMIYWTDWRAYEIQRANLVDGSNTQDLVTGLTGPTGIALDAAGGTIYWMDWDRRPEGMGKIQRASLDGSGIQDLVRGLNVPMGIALDMAGGKIYWTDWGTRRIQRANLDGSNVENLVVIGLTGPYGITLDVAGEQIYWTDPSAGKIQRANLDGSNIQDLVTGLTNPTGIALGGNGGDGGDASRSPDLVVQSPWVSNSTPTTGQSFTLRATVRNQGNARSPATTLRYYRSSNATITTSDTPVGTDAVSALSASGESVESISRRAPFSAGTYYYGACVQSVSGESDTGNNCSTGVRVTVTRANPDLVVQSPWVSDNTLTTGQSFTLRATVRNRGDARSAATTLRYYRSTNATIGASDTRVGTDAVSALGASATSVESITVRAPSSAGAYYYGACVDGVSGESDTGNNCSAGVRVTVSSANPDLVVQSPWVSDNTLTTGQTFTLRATVRNLGVGASAATQLRYYRSTNATITVSDTRVGTDAVSALSPSGGSVESISLGAPTIAGTYYYGACVLSVSGESNTGNNCSVGVRVTVSSNDDHGNTRSTATSISLGSLSGRIDPGGDLDYFRVQISSSGELTVYTTGSTDTYGTLQDAAGARLASNDDGGSDTNFRIEHQVSSGTHYIQVRGYNSSTTGSYTLTLRAELEGDSFSRDNTRFNIDLVFVDPRLTAVQRGIVREAADRWEEIITGDLPDATGVSFDSREKDWWTGIREEDFGDIVVTDEFVDDLRIYVGVHDAVPTVGYGEPVAVGWGGPFWLRSIEGQWRPTLATISIRQDQLQYRDEAYQIWLHEIGHALGIGAHEWDEMVRLPSEDDSEADTHFPGSRAVAAFDAAGGRDYEGNKVPVENGGDDGHWRESVMDVELMSPVFDPDERLSAVTVEALADLGYQVDVTRADPHEIAAEAVSKPAGVPLRRCQILRVPPRP